MCLNDTVYVYVTLFVSLCVCVRVCVSVCRELVGGFTVSEFLVVQRVIEWWLCSKLVSGCSQ